MALQGKTQLGQLLRQPGGIGVHRLAADDFGTLRKYFGNQCHNESNQKGRLNKLQAVVSVTAIAYRPLSSR